MSNWYSDGTVSLTNGSAVVVGSFTLWTDQISQGDLFTLNGDKFYEVDSVQGNTQLTLKNSFAETTVVDAPYSVIRNFTGTMQARIAAQLADLIVRYYKSMDDMTTWLTATADTSTLNDTAGAPHTVITPHGIETALSTSVLSSQKGAANGVATLDATSKLPDAQLPTSIATSISGLDTAIQGKVSSTLLGAASGVATLDESGKVPSGQLPSYVDDVVEVADAASLPLTGQSGVIYIAIDTSITYRWSGTVYVPLSSGASGGGGGGFHPFLLAGV
jgi:hypothetical protein